MLPRRKIEELKARFQLEPSLDDVYVEGDGDKRLIDVAHSHRKHHRPVYSITTIDVGSEILAEQGLSEGNRQRVLALCRALNLPKESSVRFLVDADMDRHLGREMAVPCLSYTRYTDVEGVFLFKEMLENLTVNAGRAKFKEWDLFFSSVEEVVKRVFSVRLAVEEMKISNKIPLQVNFPSVIKSIIINGEILSFDAAGFINKLKSQGLSSDCVKEVGQSSLDWYDNICHQEGRMACRGHDYFEIISWVIRKFSGKPAVADSLEDIVILLVPEVADDLLAPLT